MKQSIDLVKGITVIPSFKLNLNKIQLIFTKNSNKTNVYIVKRNKYGTSTVRLEKFPNDTCIDLSEYETIFKSNMENDVLTIDVKENCKLEYN